MKNVNKTNTVSLHLYNMLTAIMKRRVIYQFPFPRYHITTVHNSKVLRLFGKSRQYLITESLCCRPKCIKIRYKWGPFAQQYTSNLFQLHSACTFREQYCFCCKH